MAIWGRSAALVLMALLGGCAESTLLGHDGGDVGDSGMAKLDGGLDGGGADGGAVDDDDAGPDGATCVCNTLGPCCDGCNAINSGASCDDGLGCTTSESTSCQLDGSCSGGASSCEHLLTEPQCQTVSCDESLGCGAVVSARESLPCNDGDPLTLDDACVSGSCDGVPCPCAGQSTCCDGCFPINEEASCDDGLATTYDDACTGGSCQGVPCDCSSGSCCDGCRFRDVGFMCDEGAGYEDGCVTQPFIEPGTLWWRWGDRYCSGASSECDGAIAWDSVSEFTCTSDLQHCEVGDLGAECVY